MADSVSGALEHDTASLYLWRWGPDEPGPLPLGVAVIDASIVVFGLVFPRAAHKHRLQMLEHFSQHLKRQVKRNNSNSELRTS